MRREGKLFDSAERKALIAERKALVAAMQATQRVAQQRRQEEQQAVQDIQALLPRCLSCLLLFLPPLLGHLLGGLHRCY